MSYYTHKYIYPRGGRFTGNSCPKGVYIYEVSYYMVDATQVMGWGWVGVGWG